MTSAILTVTVLRVRVRSESSGAVTVMLVMLVLVVLTVLIVLVVRDAMQHSTYKFRSNALPRNSARSEVLTAYEYRYLGDMGVPSRHGS